MMIDARTEVRRALRPLAVISAAVALAITLAVVAYATARGDSPSRSDAGADTVTLVGLTPQSEERVAYEPGASRSWSVRQQVVGVAVVSGTLTVYGPAGDRQVYRAGDGFAAGWMTHRTVNETDDPVETLVTQFSAP
jgi:hypothetical protein